MHELSFSYMSPREIGRAESMLRLGTHALKVINDHYVVTSVIGVPRKHDCPIHEIMYNDIEKYGTKTVKKIYQDFVEKYGQDVCDLIFPKNEDSIRDKIARTISFTMDKVYNCDKLMIVVSGNVDNSRYDKSSIPQLVYSAVQENFEIIEFRASPKMYQITISRKKKGEII